MKTKIYLIGMIVFAFASFILFIQTSSYGADKNHTHGLFRWLGIATALIAVFCLYKVYKAWGDNPKNND